MRKKKKRSRKKRGFSSLHCRLLFKKLLFFFFFFILRADCSLVFLERRRFPSPKKSKNAMIRVPRCCCQKRRRQKDPSKKNYLGSLFCFNVSSEYLLVYFSALIEEKKSLSLIFNQKSKIFFEKGNNVPDLIQSLSPFSEKAGVEQQKEDFLEGRLLC